MASAESKPRMGLIIDTKPDYYPIELSNAELLSHFEMLQEYHQEISTNVIAQSCKFKPNPKLIDQQPEMNPIDTRSNIITFLFELSVVTRVTNGIFFHAVRLYDRYCSKRIVLRDQAKLVAVSYTHLDVYKRQGFRNGNDAVHQSTQNFSVFVFWCHWSH